MEIRHFILTNDGAISEFSADDAIRIANGAEAVPELAESRVRYLQVLLEPGDDDVTIRTAGTLVRFDETGRFVGWGSDDEPEMTHEDDIAGLSEFEHDACVEFALKHNIPGRITHH